LIRFITYLAPSLPLELFATVAARVGARLDVPVALRSEERTSGPLGAEDDPFAAGEADVGFVCAPPFLWLRDRQPPSVELLGAGLRFDDPRASGAPVYFSDVIVPAQSRVARFAELEGGVWAYNDLCSLSGFHCLVRKLAGRKRFFAALRASGSHLASIDLVARGLADGAAIDSNVLRLALARDPRLAARVRAIESWGPYPIQPIVARAGLPPELRAAITDALLGLGGDAELARLGLAGFVPVAESFYASERAALRASRAAASALEQLAATIV